MATARAKSAPRLHAALPLASGESVAVLYGLGTSDQFCCADLQLRAIDGALLHVLKAAGFERVVFCALGGVYYLDAESAAAGRPDPGEPAQGRPAEGRRLTRFSGPMGSRDVLPERTAVTNASRRTMPDPFKVKQLNALMNDESIRTAVVILRAEDFVHHNVASRDLTDRIGEWLSFGAASRNLAVLVFNSHALDGVLAAVERDHSQGALLAFLRAQRDRRSARGIGRIGPADAAELTRLVHRLRLLEGMRVADWNELPRLAGSMAARRESIKAWDRNLRALDTDAPLSPAVLRSRGLIDSASGDGRSAWERLDELTGLQTVKVHIRELAQQVRSWRFRPRVSDRTMEPPSMHLVFSGNPGTGKTTVAHLMAEIYHDIDVLPSAALHDVKASDLVGNVVGDTAIRTNGAVDAALDGVLFIDEAYRLSAADRGGFGQEAIDTLVSRLEDDRDRFVTIVAGYSRQMEQFVSSNPGLESRFETTIHFPDYAPDELLAIALGMLEGQRLVWGPEFRAALETAVEVLHAQRDPNNFANARAVRRLIHEIDRNWAVRVGEQYAEPLSALDIPERYRQQRPAAGCWERLEELIGLGPVKEHLRRLARTVESQRARAARSGRIAERGSPHLIFVGNPGTGKTTVTRLMAEAYHDIGVTRTDRLHSVEGSDLVAGFVGQTAIRTNAAVDAALGGVLFIDEAYRLTAADRGGFGQEAVDTLITRLENDRDDFVVIAAGYPAQMEEFRVSNPGLPGRFPKRNIIHFPDYDPDALLSIALHMLEDRGLAWNSGFAVALQEAVTRLHQLRDPATFGNAREMRDLADTIEENWATRVGAPYDEPVSEADLPPELREVVA